MKEGFEAFVEALVNMVVAIAWKVIDTVKVIYQLFRYYKYRFKELVKFPRKRKNITVNEITLREWVVKSADFEMEQLLVSAIPSQKKYVNKINHIIFIMRDGRLYSYEGERRINKVLTKWNRAIDEYYNEAA